MGLGSRLPAPCHSTSVRGRTLQDAGGRCLFTREAPGGGARLATCAALRPLRRCGRKRPFRLRLLGTFVSTGIRCLTGGYPKAITGPSLGCFAARVAPPDHRGSRRGALAPTPFRGFLSRVSRPSTACYRCPGPAYRERTVSSPTRLALRSRPDPLSRARPFASADLPRPLFRFHSPLARALRRSVGRCVGYEDSLLTCERASTFERQSRTWDGDRQRRIPRGFEGVKKDRIQGRLEGFFLSKTTNGEATCTRVDEA